MSLLNDKNFMKQLDTDIEKLSKILYLSNPDLWVDFLDKSNDKNFDEMSLFFATKNDLVSILRFSVEENKFNLDLPSKNKNFSSIKDSLLDVALKENAHHISSYLSDKSSPIDTDEAKSLDIEYICPNCSTNIFKSGYNTLISSTCTYSNSEKKIIKSKPKNLDSVICTKCNFEIKETSPLKLERLINIEKCVNCACDIAKVGILKEVDISFNDKSKTFIEGAISYCCKSCKNPLENSQLNHFNLI